jgi:hypothetical protein
MARPSDLPAASGGAGSMLSRLIGGRAVRYNRFLDKLNTSAFVAKVPRDFAADEENVLLGVATTPLAVAATSSQTMSVNAPRDLVLRRLLVQELGGATNWYVTSIQIEGKSYSIGGGVPSGVFSAQNINAPAEFDVPVAGGTPISITITNPTAAAQSFLAAFTID